MMSRFRVAVLVVLFAMPAGVAGQGVGIAARVGTLGIGGDLGVGVGSRLVLRGGAGVLPWDIDGEIDDIDLTIELPRTWYNLGVDLYLNGVVRVGGGLLMKVDGVTVSATPSSPQDIGGQLYSPGEIGTLTGRLSTARQAPYALIGFGKHTRSGFGLTLDIGAAFLRNPRVTLDAEGGTLVQDPDFRSRLETEARNFEDDLPRYLEIWPILSLGFRARIGP
jgi:hypothetical protein